SAGNFNERKNLKVISIFLFRFYTHLYLNYPELEMPNITDPLERVFSNFEKQIKSSYRSKTAKKNQTNPRILI
ncbi:MAG: hypothetical protein KAX28_09985, partial [Candidatus Marinimicrobia bacterium]|nr:hypothetical protein [Candidatus Neomarinimicrobiota bacterium]